MRHPTRLLLLLALSLLVALAATAAAAKLPRGGQFARIEYVVDGDTVALTNGRHVRLVQIDTPEVYFSPECYGAQASRITKHLLPPGTAVRLYREPKTDAVDGYGRLLRYVFRVRDGLDVNVQLVRVGPLRRTSTTTGAAVMPGFSFVLGSVRGDATSVSGVAATGRRGTPTHGVSTGPP